jgi:hypothetical protein
MATSKRLLGQGNNKLGRVLTFSLPAVTTCPGSTLLCRSACYATRGRFRTPPVQNRLRANLDASRQPDFVERIVAELSSRRSDRTLVRLHPSGDFYGVAYARKWLAIARRSPRARFWFYTRSWRVPGMRRVLEALARLPNVQAWNSVDQESGFPDVAGTARTAYLMTDAADLPATTPDLYFRDYPLRPTVVKRIDGVLVCPPENGVSHAVHCDSCRLCSADPDDEPQRRTRRIPLAVL